MDKQKQIEEMARDLCPHYADGKCYYEMNETSTCDFECEFCWAVSLVSVDIVKRFSEKLKIKFAYDIERCKAVDEIAKEFTGEKSNEDTKM